MVDLQRAKLITQLYQDPFCTCYLKEVDQAYIRVFEIKDEAICNELMMDLVASDLDVQLLKNVLYLSIPYDSGINIMSWLQQPHTMIERITICEQIIFELMRCNYPDRIQRMCIDLTNICICDDGIKLFQHPSFSRLLHKQKQETIVQLSVELCYEIMEKDTLIHRYDYLKDPIEFQDFRSKILWKRLRSFDAIMSELMYLKQCQLQDKKKHRKKIHIFYILLATILCLCIGLLIVSKFMEISSQSYQGIPEIGSEYWYHEDTQ